MKTVLCKNVGVQLEPTPNYDCHIAKPNVDQATQLAPHMLLYTTQVIRLSILIILVHLLVYVTISFYLFLGNVSYTNCWLNRIIKRRRFFSRPGLEPANGGAQVCIRLIEKKKFVINSILFCACKLSNNQQKQHLTHQK